MMEEKKDYEIHPCKTDQAREILREMVSFDKNALIQSVRVVLRAGYYLFSVVEEKEKHIGFTMVLEDEREYPLYPNISLTYQNNMWVAVSNGMLKRKLDLFVECLNKLTSLLVERQVSPVMFEYAMMEDAYDLYAGSRGEEGLK